jgi:hypothetical protein
MTPREYLFETIIKTVKAFDGDVYGSVIRDFKINKNTDVAHMHCRIDVHLMSVFGQTLNVLFDVIELPIYIGGPIGLIKRYLLTPKPFYPCTSHGTVLPLPVILEAAMMTKSEWSRQPCDLDVNLFAENGSSRYIRTDYHILHKFVDRYEHLMQRIKNMKFCVVDFSTCKSMALVRAFVDNTMSMIVNGWTMDDLIWGDETWVVNKWITFQMRPKDIRTKYTIHKIERMLAQDECMLCNEKFSPTDIVINTRCNHNFHWGPCQSSDDNGAIKCYGLVEWVKQNKITCPCCRTAMF